MNKHLSLILFLAILVSGCNQEELSRNESVNGKTFTASFEQNESRTYIEDGKYLRWTTGDHISLFNSNTLNQQYKFDGKTGDNSGTFSKVETTFGTGNDLNCHYAVYPYASDITITESGIITATLPAEQNYAENSFGLDANTMVAVTENTDDTFLKFKNAGGYLKLQLYGDDVTVKSITLTGNKNEKLAGTATITPVYGQDPTISMADDATYSIILDCGEGVTIGSTTETATAFWIVVPPTTFENGFEVTITDVNDNEVTKSTSNEISIERNTIKPMPAFEVKIESSTEIVYDVQIAGTLKDILPTDYLTMTSLKVKGYLNGADIAVIREMAGRDMDKNATEGKLEYLDMKDANIVTSSEAYYYTYTTEENTIGNDMFYQTNLKEIILPNSLTKIGARSFFNCSSLTTIDIPNSVITIFGTAFAQCTNLQNITIPSGITEISAETFSGCSSLTKVTIPNGVTKIGHSAFANCTNLAEISIPNSVLSIGNDNAAANGAFSNCTNLKSLTLPASVTSLGHQTFSGCTQLTTITIPNSVTSLGNNVFNGCTNLSEITLSKNITKINTGTFWDCTSLKNLTLPASVEAISTASFKNAPLTQLKCEAINPPTLDASAFIPTNCVIYVPSESVSHYQSADNWKNFTISAIQ